MRMKPSSPNHKPVEPSRARNAALINQFATPGLGSLMAGRWLTGSGQLLLAITGFVMFVLWFAEMMRELYGQIDGNVQVRHVGWLAKWGIIVFAIAWCWSLVTSISLLREAERNRAAEAMRPLIKPPVLK